MLCVSCCIAGLCWLIICCKHRGAHHPYILHHLTVIRKLANLSTFCKRLSSTAPVSSIRSANHSFQLHFLSIMTMSWPSDSHISNFCRAWVQSMQMIYFVRTILHNPNLMLMKNDDFVKKVFKKLRCQKNQCSLALTGCDQIWLSRTW